MMKKIVFLLIYLSFSIITFAQKYPHPVLPGQKYTVQPQKDTLWIITDSQLEKALIAAKQLENADAQIKNYQEQIKNLRDQIAQRDSIIDITTKNKGYYEKNWKDCSDNLKILVDENKKQATKLKVSKIIGGVATIAAFFLGAYIF